MNKKFHILSPKLFYSVWLLICLFSFSAFSQDWVMPVDGKVYSNSEKLNGAIITLFKNGQQIQQVVTTTNGRFSFELAPNAEFMISVTKPGFITKKFKVNTANVPVDRALAGSFNPFEPDVTLFEMPSAPEVAKRVEAILSQPIAIYQYNPVDNNFNYDEKYTKVVQDKLVELSQLQKQTEKEMQEKVKNAAVEAQKQLEADNKYKAMLAKADKTLAASNYALAKDQYNEALAVKPTDAYPKTKLAEIDKLLANANAQKEVDAKYQAAITKADAAFGTKDYASAKTAYTEASGIKSAEAYPKTKLAEIDKLLATANAQKEVDAKYQAAITKADAAFGTKDFTSAKTAYAEASGIKPTEAYPKTKLAEIEKLLASANAQKEVDAKYQAAITKADAAFGTKDFTSAKTAYAEASGIKPTEAYPKTKLAEIDKLLASANAQKELDAKYQAAIIKADAAFGTKDFTSAKTTYLEASGIKPTEAYPKTKLAEIDKLLASELASKLSAEKEQKYNAAILKGNNAFKVKDYIAAKQAFSTAIENKPTEQYPKTKLTEIEKILSDLEAQKSAAANQKELDEKYKVANAKGDISLGTKNYSSAEISYKEASSLKPTEEYPKNKLKEIEKILANQKSLDDQEQAYKGLISKSNQLLADKDYENAKSNFKQASDMKPSDVYPKQMIQEIDVLIKKAGVQAEKDKLDKSYKDAITRGDLGLNEKNFATAKIAYNEALSYKKNEQYPKDKLLLIERSEKDQALALVNKEKNAKYDQLIGTANQLYSSKKYAQAKTIYQEAITYKKEDPYPKDRIKLIDALLKDPSSTASVPDSKNKEPVLTAEELKKKTQSELRSKYPAGVTEEEFVEGGKTFLRRVVIRDDFAGIYLRITHSWGGVFFFKDNVPITESMFEIESK